MVLLRIHIQRLLILQLSPFWHLMPGVHPVMLAGRIDMLQQLVRGV